MEQWPLFYHSQPLVIAHRGASGSAPENTMAAFQAAIDEGADGIELDVTRCASGEIVVIHDDTVDRTTDGSGAVADLELDALRALDAGSWFAPSFAGERIPLLAEVLDAYGASLRINIEIKGRELCDGGVEKEIAAMVRERRLQESVLISSFNPCALKRMQAAAPELQRGLLFVAPSTMFRAWSWAGHWVEAHALHPSAAGLDAAWVARAREGGYRVNAWTVNDPEEMLRVVASGVDGVITNYPGRLRALLQRCRAGEDG
ncbi:MAG TPA: glycerophosphodiester phosphodiesterase [Chloroflexi bacterium]|nr:glycerophosphodiester phosphodiesterase [Chloroflexota bacterium]